MIERVRSYIEQWNMIMPGTRVVAGVSGGADSVCLCLLLKQLSEEMNFTLEVIHVEHGIRGEDSRKDEQFVQRLCTELGILCHVEVVDVPAYATQHHMGLEEAARILRYRVFAGYAANVPECRIALAHHMEDNAETILLQMIRGSGLDGLCGMRPLRRGTNGECYIRPLLECSRSEIEEFLQSRGQAYCSDITNEDLSYSRNRVRHKVMPELSDINAQAVIHINQAAEFLGELRDYLDELTDTVMLRTVKTKEDGVALDVNSLENMPQVLRMRVIQRAAAQAAGAKKDWTRAHLEAIASLLTKQTGRRVDLPYELTAKRAYREILLYRKKKDVSQKARMEISSKQLHDLCCSGEKQTLVTEVQGSRFTLRVFPFHGKISEIPRKMYTKWFDYDKIKNGFSIRNREPQDFFMFDVAGHHKKLGDYFITEKIPSEERERCLLITQGAQVLWIVGGRMGCTALVENTTRLILEIAVDTVTSEIIEGGTNDGL